MTSIEPDPISASISAKPLAGPRRGLRVLAALVIALLLAAAGLILDRLDITIASTLDKALGDFRIAYGSPRAPEQRPDIAVVLITEETRIDYESSSPIDRALLAELIAAIDRAQPEAIALDLIFDRPTRHDARLIAAIKAAKAPVILGAIDARLPGSTKSIERQAAFLAAAGAPYGHLYFERKVGLLPSTGDTTVRLVASPAPVAAKSGAPRPPEAFADVIARAVKKPHTPELRDIAWLRTPASGEPLFLTLTIPAHDPAALQPAMAGVFRDSWRELIKGRVVLVGANMVDRDQHTTPLSVLEGPVPGVMVHAQALAQRLDAKRDIRAAPLWAMFLVVAAVALACFAAARKFGFNPQGAAYGAVGLVLIGLLSVLAYGQWKVNIPSIALTTAWLGGGFLGFASGWIYRRLGIDDHVEVMS